MGPVPYFFSGYHKNGETRLAKSRQPTGLPLIIGLFPYVDPVRPLNPREKSEGERHCMPIHASF
jgi:hypothetical protein